MSSARVGASRLRLSIPAEEDLAGILSTSTERWGKEASERYVATMTAALRRIAANPQGSPTRDCSSLLSGMRSFHIRHVRQLEARKRVRNPVHVIFYRTVRPGLIEVARILHERMDPARHLPSSADD